MVYLNSEQVWRGFISAQIGQSAAVTSSVVTSGDHVTGQTNKGFNSAEYALFDVALHVPFWSQTHKNIYAYHSWRCIYFTCK